MLQPDSEGCINVEWPSRNVPHGGIFHPKRVNYSKQGEEFLKVLLEESRLNILQRKKSHWELRQQEEKSKQGHRHQPPVVRPHTSRRRSLSTIRESGAFAVEDYRPRMQGEDRDKLKMQLQHVMAYGDTDPSRTSPPVTSHRPKSITKTLPSSNDMKNDLLTQIQERINWLAEMEALGRGAEHRDIIRDQIAERLRTLDALGINYTCLSARSNISKTESIESLKTETARSHQALAKNGNSENSNTSRNEGTTKSSRESINTGKSTNLKQKRENKTLSRNLLKEENVAAFDLITPLQYSPRRRC